MSSSSRSSANQLLGISDTDKLCLEDFELGDELGAGSYSTVYKATRQNHSFAMKIVSKAQITRLGPIRQRLILSEKKILFLSRHPGIIKLFHTFADNENLYFIFEYCPINFGIWLKEYENNNYNYGNNNNNNNIRQSLPLPPVPGRPISHSPLPIPLPNPVGISMNSPNHSSISPIFTERECAWFMAELLSSLYYLHSEIGIAHRDVKMENICFSSEYHMKLIDFGESCIINNPALTGTAADGKSNRKSTISTTIPFVGSPAYISPELIHQRVCLDMRNHLKIQRKIRKEKRKLKNQQKLNFITEEPDYPSDEENDNNEPNDDEDDDAGNSFTCCRALIPTDLYYSDLWASGILLYYLTIGRLPFNGASEYLLMKNICNRKLDGGEEFDPIEDEEMDELPDQDFLIDISGLSAFESHFSPESLDFLSLLWHPEALKRPGVTLEGFQFIKSHPFFVKHQIPWDKLFQTNPPFAKKFGGKEEIIENAAGNRIPRANRPTSQSVSMPPLPTPPPVAAAAAFRVHVVKPPTDRRLTAPSDEKTFRPMTLPAPPIQLITHPIARSAPVSPAVSSPNSPRGDDTADENYHWNRFLDAATESMILTGAVEKRGPMFLKSKYQLLLTSMPRLLWIDPNSMSVKDQRLIAVRDKVAASINENRADEFSIHFNGEKPISFISLSIPRAVDWVRKINETVSLEQQKFQL